MNGVLPVIVDTDTVVDISALRENVSASECPVNVLCHGVTTGQH